MAIENPRALKEITEYRDLLNDRDSAMNLVNAVLALDTAVIETAFNVTVTAALKPTASPAINSPAFNKYAALWIKRNIRTVAPDIIALIDSEIANNKVEAEEEASLLGMSAAPVLTPAPVITSTLTTTTTAGAAFEYQITANYTTGAGVTSCVYSISGQPAWITGVDATTGKVTGTVPADATSADAWSFDITVTTNNGTDTKTVDVSIA